VEETAITEISEKPKTIIRRTQLRHREVISRLVYHCQTVQQIAEELGFSEVGLHRIIRSPLFQIELQKELNIKQKIERDNILQSVANNGLTKLAEALQTGKMTFVERDEVGNEIKRTEKVLDGREIISIAHDALNRTGHSPAKPATIVQNNTKVETKIDLGAMVISAHKKVELGTLDVPPPDPDMIEIEFEDVADDK
jgi:hypothetical protein